MLTRIHIKNITTNQIKEIVENTGRASLIVSPSEEDLWTVSVCLRTFELEKIKNLGYTFEKVPG